MNNEYKACEKALYGALRNGMPKENAEQFLYCLITCMAADNIGMKTAAERGFVILKRLAKRPAAMVEASLKPHERISSGLCDPAKEKLLEEVARIGAAFNNA